MSDLMPTNIEAEEAILGGILIDPEAISRIAELLRPEFFAITAHQVIYRSALGLFLQGQPTDLMTVTTWLTDRNQLEQVGGLTKLAQLVDRTVSAVNIDQYAALVEDKYQRRKLIEAGNNIVQLGYETAAPLETVLDRAEQEIFSITQERPQQDLVSIGETLNQTFQDLENRNEGLTLPGIPCGFYDLDAMTGGFQRSDLIIVAARPAMGKTAFCTNIAHHIAAGQQKFPVAVFSLEMSKEQLVQRILSSEAKIESNRLRSGRISQNEWEPISTAIGNLSELPLFIDDTPNITVMEIRSKARRLQAEQGGTLGLILLDYLQLMEGSSDNRVQELSRITRSLKGLARELNVPIIALSQLSRGVEARTNKRPMMSDLRECVTGDTPVLLADGRRVPIRDLVGQEPMVLAMNHLEKIAVAKSDKVWRVGVKPVFILKLASGRSLKATAQHRIYTEQGWQELKSVQMGSRVAIARFIPEPQKPINWKEHEISLLAHLMGDGSYLKGQPLRYTTASEENSEKAMQDNFLEQIGSVGCKVADAGRLKMTLAGINANPNRDTLPKEVFQTIRERMRECNVTTRQMSKLRETAYGGSAHFSFAPSRETVLDYAKLLDSDALVQKASSDLFWDEVINISAAGEEEVFDLTVPGVESWLADGIVSHNSGSIEQDADLVIMLYRDEYYNPDSPDRGIAEVIITKHRNGPTGIIKLLFDAQFTSFRNLASPKRS